MEAIEYNRMAALHAQRWQGLGSAVYLSLGKARRQPTFQHEKCERKLTTEKCERKRKVFRPTLPPPNVTRTLVTT